MGAAESSTPAPATGGQTTPAVFVIRNGRYEASTEPQTNALSLIGRTQVPKLPPPEFKKTQLIKSPLHLHRTLLKVEVVHSENAGGNVGNGTGGVGGGRKAASSSKPSSKLAPGEAQAMISIGDDSDFEIASSVCSSTQDDVVSPQGKGSSRSSGGTIYLTIGFDSLCPAGVSVTCQDDGPFPFSTLHVTRPRGLKQTVRFAVGPADRVPADGVKLKVNLFRDLTRCKQASDIHGQISHLRILPATSLPSTISTTSAAAGEQLQQQNASSPLRVELVRQALQYDAPQSGALSSSGCNDLLNQNDLEDDIKAGDHNLEKRRLLQLHSENKGGPQSGEEEHLWDMQEVFGVKNLDGGDSSEESGCAPCQEEMCIICMSDPRDTLVLPCRHMAFCTECAEVMRHQCEKCPICRQNVSSLLRFEREQPKEPAAATRSLMDI